MLDPTDRATMQVYDRVAASYAQRLPDLSYEAPEDRAVLDSFISAVRVSDRPNGPVLDAGCGTGRVSSYLSRQGLVTFGVDLSMSMLRQAGGHAPEMLLQGALGRLPVRTASAAGLLAWYSIIHTPPHDLARTIAEFARVLRPDAPLLVAFQAGEGESVRHEKAYGHAVDMLSFHHRPADVIRLLGMSGFVRSTSGLRPPRASERSTQAFLQAIRA